MKKMRRIIEKHRTWIGKRFYYIFILIGLLVSILGGFVPYLMVINAPNFSFNPSFSGFGVARNDTAVPSSEMVIGIGSDPPELWFQYFFDCTENGSYYFIFAFPFCITSEIRTSGNASLRATSRGSAIWFRYETDSVYFGRQPAEVWGDFSIENTYVSGSRGSYTFILPFGMGIHPDVVGNIQRELNVPFHTPDANISLQVGLPSRYRITGMFPPVSAGPNVWMTPSNRPLVTMEWKFQTLQDSVTIQCEDLNEISFYEVLPFISGIFIGVGVPVTITTIYDAVKEWARPIKTKENK